MNNYGYFGYNFYKDFLKIFIKKLNEKMRRKLLSCILYGSVARGKAKSQSDIDLLILHEGSDLDISKIYARTINEARESEEYKKLLEKGVYSELSPYFLTVEELKENPLILQLPLRRKEDL